MKFESKYGIGETVCSIRQRSVERPPVACPACEDGHVLLRGEKYQCPSCKGTAKVQARAFGWVTGDEGTVGQVEVEYAIGRGNRYGEDYPDGEYFAFVKYMMNTSGSGTIYPEPDLFPSRKEAQAECDRRNGYAPSVAVLP